MTYQHNTDKKRLISDDDWGRMAPADQGNWTQILDPRDFFRPKGDEERVKDEQLRFLANLYGTNIIDLDGLPMTKDDPRLTHKWYVSALINRKIGQRSAPAEDVGGVLEEAMSYRLVS